MIDRSMDPVLTDDSPPPGHDSDDAASSGYSSCEGSDFDRYCSANSAFGSSSQCSSVGHHSDLLDSFKNHDKLRWSRWNTDCSSSDGGVESPRPGGIRIGSRLSLGSNANFTEAFLPSTSASAHEERTFLDGNSGLVVNGISSSVYELMLEGDGGGLSGCECSDDEDSMLSYGSDDESQLRLYEKNRLQNTKVVKAENGNPLLINSSVAFGSGDWDGFEQESGGNGFASLSLYQDESVGQQHVDSEMGRSVSKSISDGVDVPVLDGSELENRMGDLPAISWHKESTSQSTQNVGESAVVNPSRDHEGAIEHKLQADKCSLDGELDLSHDSPRGEIPSLYTNGESEELVFCDPELPETPFSDSATLWFHSTLTEAGQDKEVKVQEFDRARHLEPADKNGHNSSLRTIMDGNSNSVDLLGEDLVPDEAKELDTYGTYDEMVLEMEEILLDSGKPYGARFTQVDQSCISQQSHHLRDGSSTASTSGTDDTYPLHHQAKIDWIEVVGAKQKNGDVSFGERLVGVKEYTVYKLRVWSSNDQWDVERRYRDFYALYRRLRTLFTNHGLSLPSPWSSVERESRKIFGNASPVVVSERSTLIQNCLRSILNSRYPFGTPSSLISFLSPGKGEDDSSMLKPLHSQSPEKLGEDEKSKFLNSEETDPKDISMFGKTISLFVEIKPQKSLRQLLEEQHYTCAGCHRHLDAGKNLLREIVQTLGWNKPRLCEYTGQLFCASCHTNDTAVLPARVLHLWDFSLYPVSQFAKAYLESIYEQPMLCVSAVNPFLFSKVPALLHVVGIRKKIGAMLPCIRCPFRRSIRRGLGLRRHLLESNDFFALRDLVDLSKGAFAVLPVILGNISNKIFEHITQQCLECYDAGVPCAARQACVDPSSLIFPFQESEAARCTLCGSIFHEHCFQNLMGCPCGKSTTVITEQSPHRASAELDKVLDKSIRSPGSSSTAGLFADFLSMARPDKIWKPRNKSPVILMGSLPSTSL